MPWFTGLKGQALKIAKTTTSPLRVVAGPGTGKSFALKRRVARLLEEKTDPTRILVVTFTRNAAFNLLNDLSSIGIEGCNRIITGTLHSYCMSILSRQHVFDYLGRVPRAVIYFNKSGVMQYEGASMLQDIISHGGLGNKRDSTKRIRAFEAAWARLQSDIPGWPFEAIDIEFQRVLIDWLIFHRGILIGELIPLALQYLRNNPEAPELISFDHILVDEYQDLNKAEQVFIDLLCNVSTQTLVGDPDQSIYSFRHANPLGITTFHETHPGTHDEPLRECRRCPTRAVAIADHLIGQNYPAHELSRLEPLPGNPVGEIHIVQWPNIRDEAQGITDFCHYLIHRKNYLESDILILTPRRMLGYAIRDTLTRSDIPAHSFYHEELLESEIAQEKFSLLTLLCNPNDRITLRFLLGLGSPSWNSTAYRRLRGYCEETGESPWQVLQNLYTGSIQIAGTIPLVNRFRIIREQLEQLRNLKGYALMDALFPDGEEWAKSFREVTFLLIDEETDQKKLYDFLITHITQPEMPEGGEFVRVMSLHKSKGLTSRVVIVSGCIEGLIPTVNPDNTPEEARYNLEEQRRLFYVAVTRCQEILVLSSVTMLEKSIAYRLGARVAGPGIIGGTFASRFISDLGPEAPEAKRGVLWVENGFV